MKIGLFIQIRLDSTRLKQKALKPFGKKTMTEYILNRLNKVNVDLKAVLTEENSYLKLKDLIENNKDLKSWKIFKGSKENVLNRFIKAIEYYNVDYVIRATGDNPFLSYEFINESLNNLGYDYFTFKGMPVGTGVELIKAEALKKAENKLNKDQENYNYFIEHVCPYLYQNPDLFKIKYKDFPYKNFDLNNRVTVDTLEDYNRALDLLDKIKNDTIIELLNYI